MQLKNGSTRVTRELIQSNILRIGYRLILSLFMGQKYPYPYLYFSFGLGSGNGPRSDFARSTYDAIFWFILVFKLVKTMG